MAEPTGSTDDASRADHKEDAARVERESVGDVMVLVVGNTNVYPKQAREVARAVGGAMLSATPPKVLVDLSRVEFICSAFIGQLIDLHKEARAAGGDLKIHVTGEHVAYTMKLVKMDTIVDVSADRQELIEAF